MEIRAFLTRYGVDLSDSRLFDLERLLSQGKSVPNVLNDFDFEHFFHEMNSILNSFFLEIANNTYYKTFTLEELKELMNLIPQIRTAIQRLNHMPTSADNIIMKIIIASNIVSSLSDLFKRFGLSSPFDEDPMNPIGFTPSM